MKKLIFNILIISLSLNIYAQNSQKDTIYFLYNKQYIIEDIEFNNLDCNEKAKKKLLNKNITNTNGYIYFIKDTILTNLNPNHILPIKEYIENKEFYLQGKFNKIVDKWKLKSLLLDKHIIFLVKDNKYIKPKYINYNSYYPIGKGDNAIINKTKDTLFFKFDENYLLQLNNGSDNLTLVDSNSDETFYFERQETTFDLKVETKLDLKNFIQSSQFFRKDYFRKLLDNDLSEYLENYVIFLIDENKFIKVKSRVEIQ
ncbi:hypothetical protein [Flavicella sediminum]|uniref:hypothetical protein n=1 Tax=Flavicella sediminum TaxID=2585141 RepID=UPI0011210685|nr:hypothetical protein [Flavicella sediminum]